MNISFWLKNWILVYIRRLLLSIQTIEYKILHMEYTEIWKPCDFRLYGVLWPAWDRANLGRGYCCRQYTLLSTKQRYCCRQYTLLSTKQRYCCRQYTLLSSKQRYCCRQYTLGTLSKCPKARGVTVKRNLNMNITKNEITNSCNLIFFSVLTRDFLLCDSNMAAL